MKNNHPRRPEGRQQIQQRPFWHLLYLHGDHEEAWTRFPTSACFKRRFTIGPRSRLLTVSGRVFSIFGSPPTGPSAPCRFARSAAGSQFCRWAFFFPLFLSPTQFQISDCICHVWTDSLALIMWWWRWGEFPVFLLSTNLAYILVFRPFLCSHQFLIIKYVFTKIRMLLAYMLYFKCAKTNLNGFTYSKCKPRCFVLFFN